MVSEKKREQKRMMLMPITALDGQGIFAFFFLDFAFCSPFAFFCWLLLRCQLMPICSVCSGLVIEVIKFKSIPNALHRLSLSLSLSLSLLKKKKKKKKKKKRKNI